MGDSDAQKDLVPREALRDERWQLLAQLHALLARPLLILSFAWVALTILNFTTGLDRPLRLANDGIWALFVANFALEFTIAPRKREYLRGNWLTALSLLLPAFSALRILRVVRLLRLVALFKRNVRALRATFGRRGFGFVVTLTAIVALAGAAGMLQCESPAALRMPGRADLAAGGGGLHGYPETVRWTAMLLTTFGSDSWSVTAAGRLLCWLLALYAFTVCGHITATLASHFVDVDQGDRQTTGVGPTDIAALHRELAALRAQVALLLARDGSGGATPSSPRVRCCRRAGHRGTRDPGQPAGSTGGENGAAFDERAPSRLPVGGDSGMRPRGGPPPGWTVAR